MTDRVEFRRHQSLRVRCLDGGQRIADEGELVTTHDDVPTDEEIAAALAAVRLLLRRRAHARDTGSRWARAGRVEAVTGTPGIAGWATAERPR